MLILGWLELEKFLSLCADVRVSVHAFSLVTWPVWSMTLNVCVRYNISLCT